ncbi:hypothetical protein KY284_035819 [Solanum tuberosum]|uniref:Uncharacterized protein n=1 Tax=Solanum tuberosum TaxID=4113 RepID=M1CJM2_SOLTU|nr:hypothetical protein KY284_035819 [Solanum tuberosum]
MNLPNETQIESGACSISYQSKTLCIQLMNEFCHSNNKPYQENTGDGSQQIRLSSIQISDFAGARLVKVAAGVGVVVAASEFCLLFRRLQQREESGREGSSPAFAGAAASLAWLLAGGAGWLCLLRCWLLVKLAGFVSFDAGRR